uniref:Uncharacterized protein n=1 Tax=Ixodes ricinus TaxID=34613 RepID=A0A6B0UR80_IXORI
MLAVYLLIKERYHVILDRCIIQLRQPTNTLEKEGCAHSTDVLSSAKSSFCRSVFSKHFTRISRTLVKEMAVAEKLAWTYSGRLRRQNTAASATHGSNRTLKSAFRKPDLRGPPVSITRQTAKTTAPEIPSA